MEVERVARHVLGRGDDVLAVGAKGHELVGGDQAFTHQGAGIAGLPLRVGGDDAVLGDSAGAVLGPGLVGGAVPIASESQAVLRAGLEGAPWISVDDTGARHGDRNGVTTQIGNDAFAWFGTTFSKSRLNFLELLRAGHGDYVLNAAAFAYMHKRNLAGPVIARLAEAPGNGCKSRRFASEGAWMAHLEQLGITALNVHPEPVRIATEGALWGAIQAHGLLADTVILSDDAGQFNVGRHALCWVHAERLIHKLDAFTDHQRREKERIQARLWSLYAALKAYRRKHKQKARRATGAPLRCALHQ